MTNLKISLKILFFAGLLQICIFLDKTPPISETLNSPSRVSQGLGRGYTLQVLEDKLTDQSFVGISELPRPWNINILWENFYEKNMIFNILFNMGVNILRWSNLVYLKTTQLLDFKLNLIIRSNSIVNFTFDTFYRQ